MKRAFNILGCALVLAACGTSDAGTNANTFPGTGTPGGTGGADVDGAAGGSPGTPGEPGGTATPGGGTPGGGTPGGGTPGGGTPGGGTPGGATPGGGTPGDDGGTGPISGTATRFVVLGDGGTGDAAQKKVAGVVKSVCAKLGCEFALYLGDNIYESGVNGVDDAQFKAKFEDPYADLDFPFYVALGNHDYGSNGSNLLPDDTKSAHQVEYTGRSEKWTMPDHFYSFEKGSVGFFALDTNAIVLDRYRPAAEQESWLSAEMAKSQAPWKIVFGHHPYISTGDHGNAGNYDGGPFLNGAPMKDLVEEAVCGKAQVYFSGHDHHLEWLEPTCGTTFIVSGAAAKLRGLPNRDDQPTRFAENTKHGFLWVEVDGDTLTGVFYDEDGKDVYTDTVTRSP